MGTVTPALASDSAPLSTGWLPLSVPRCTPPSCPGPGRWACPGSAPRPEDPRRPAASAPRPAVYGRATALRAGSRRRGAVVTASLLAGALVAAERPQPQAACSFSGRSRSHQMATSTPVPQAVQVGYFNLIAVVEKVLHTQRPCLLASLPTPAPGPGRTWFEGTGTRGAVVSA